MWLPDAAATTALGRAIGDAARDGDLILLEGALGAGKTTLVRGVAEALGADAAAVRSPTFALMIDHARANGGVLVHADLYRLGGGELEAIGLLEVLGAAGVIAAVEWPGLLAPYLKGLPCWRVGLDAAATTTSPAGRRARVAAPSGRTFAWPRPC